MNRESFMGKSWSDRLSFLGAFTLFFGVYLLFLKGPASNPQQHAFRVGVFAAGVLLSIAALVMKAFGGRGGTP
jgi:drug/metabolite transporter (DMT)-like permease